MIFFGMETQAAVHFDHISKSFDDNQILSDCSLAIPKNTIFGIVGMSGCGKTTLLDMLVGFINPDKGRVFVATHKTGGKLVPIEQNLSMIKETVGFAPQIPSFYPKLTVSENLEHYASLYGIARKKRVEYLNDLLALTELTSCKDRLCDQLSLGMQKRVGIACALVHKPDILILDEPTADLDPVLRKQTWALVKEISALGTTVIIASHFLEELEEICSYLAILHKGKILLKGTPRSIREHYSKDNEIILKTDPQNYDLILETALKKKKHPVKKMMLRDDRLVLLTGEAEEVATCILAALGKLKIQLIELTIAKPSLNEIFEALTK